LSLAFSWAKKTKKPRKTAVVLRGFEVLNGHCSGMEIPAFGHKDTSGEKARVVGAAEIQ
jgi:hypothetical protein